MNTTPMTSEQAHGYIAALHTAGLVKNAQMSRRLWEAMTKRPWQEGLVDVGDELSTALQGFGRTAGDAVETTRRTTRPVGRMSAPADPRMATYGPRPRT